jgi:hypothetical protein
MDDLADEGLAEGLDLSSLVFGDGERRHELLEFSAANLLCGIAQKSDGRLNVISLELGQDCLDLVFDEFVRFLGFFDSLREARFNDRLEIVNVI